MRRVITQRSLKLNNLQGRSIFLLFFENSTRTCVSFERAGKTLGADIINVSIARSSVEKGESLLNTVRTLNAMAPDGLVVRHPCAGASNFVARHVDAPVINAGDGSHAHPTQALLDVMTLTIKLGSISGAKIAIVGDILHSRVARSDIIAFTRMGAEVVLAGPATLIPSIWRQARTGPATRGRNNVPAPKVHVCETLSEALSGADVIMPLRLQIERQKNGMLPGLTEYSRVWRINADRVAMASPDALVMHPGPMNEGIEISTEVAHGGSSLIEEQVTNGVAMRMAVLERYCRNG